MPHAPYWDEIHLTAPQRDELIVRMRQQGYSLRAIARRVGMKSAISVSRALQRISEGRPPRDPRA
jgi:IS30 family transposase